MKSLLDPALLLALTIVLVIYRKFVLVGFVVLVVWALWVGVTNFSHIDIGAQ